MKFDHADQPYLPEPSPHDRPAYSDYRHLSRVREWRPHELMMTEPVVDRQKGTQAPYGKSQHLTPTFLCLSQRMRVQARQVLTMRVTPVVEWHFTRDNFMCDLY